MVRFIASVGVTGLALALAALATQGTLYAGLAIALAVGLTVVISLGAEQTGVYLLITAMFFAPMSGVRPTSSASSITLSDILMFLGFALLVPTLLGRRLKMPSMWQISAALLFVIGMVACLASTEPTTSLGYFFKLIVAAVVLPLMYAWWRPEGKVLRAAAYAYVAGQSISVLDSLASSGHGSRAEGLSTHPNFFGLCALLALSLTFALAPRASRNARIALAFADVLMMYAIVQSGSRAALIVAALMFIVLAAVERSALTGTVVIAGGLLAAALSSYLLQLGGSGGALQRLTGNATSSYSDNTRTHQLSTAFHQIAGHPVTGVGFENTLAAQNIYVEVAVAAGIIGAVAYIFILISYVRPLFARGPNSRYAYPVLAYILIGALTNSLWDRFVWSVLALAAVAMTTPSSSTEDLDDAESLQSNQLALEEIR